ncbi:MAG: hypothetical protein KAT14_03615 [Candidatus Marinimicrobia bacterium]|nr:hypothetical protein [Candidatus Neomarinimicrobiota bacterium]
MPGYGDPPIGKGNRFSSTNQPKNRGRKPSILKKYIKDNGVTTDDMLHCFKYVLGKSMEELKEIIKDPKKPVVIVSAATAVLKDMTKGKMDNISTIMRKANIDPEQSVSDSQISPGVDIGGENQFHEYNYPEADELP